MINNVTNSATDAFKVTIKSDKANVKSSQGNQEENKQDAGEKVTLGAEKEPSVTYNKGLDASTSITIKFQMVQLIVSSIGMNQGAISNVGGDNKNQSINDLLVQFFNKNGLSTDIDIGGGKTANIQTITPDEAKKLIADDGYWGVEQTSDRIVGFVAGYLQSDPSKMEQIKNAIMHGFDEAKAAFGGQLPDISQKTIDAVMSKLDKLGKPEAAE